MQAHLMGEAWDRTPHDRGLATQFVIHGTDARIYRFLLGAHAPRLTPDDIDRIHRLWTEAVQTIGPSVHHRDVVAAALDSLETELQLDRPRGIDRVKRNVK
jgi:hypothetical protein